MRLLRDTVNGNHALRVAHNLIYSANFYFIQE